MCQQGQQTFKKQYRSVIIKLMNEDKIHRVDITWFVGIVGGLILAFVLLTIF